MQNRQRRFNIVCERRYKERGSFLKKEVPVWEKANLTVEEAAAYSGIGLNKIRELSNDERCSFVLWVRNKRLIKRRLFDSYIEKVYSI